MTCPHRPCTCFFWLLKWFPSGLRSMISGFAKGALITYLLGHSFSVNLYYITLENLSKPAQFVLFCLDQGFQMVFLYFDTGLRPSCMSHMRTRAEMPWENNFQVPIPRAQRVADRVHLWLAFLPVWDSDPQDAEREVSTPYRLSHPGRLYKNDIFSLWNILNSYSTVL